MLASMAYWSPLPLNWQLWPRLIQEMKQKQCIIIAAIARVVESPLKMVSGLDSERAPVLDGPNHQYRTSVPDQLGVSYRVPRRCDLFEGLEGG